jgi:DNA-binding MarR family transcriptional regulator
MRSRSEHDSKKQAEATRELAVLSEVSLSPDLTQRELADRVGLSLGVTNLLLQSLVRKGYLRMRRAGWRRWLYALTPSGMTHKLALTTNYVGRFLGQYRQVRSYLSEQIDPESLNGGRRVAVYGTGDLAQLVHLVLGEVGIEDVTVVMPDDDFIDIPGLETIPLSKIAIADYDHFVIAALADVSERCAELAAMKVPAEQINVLFDGARGR